MSKRNERARIAADTLAILERGHFRSPTGDIVSIAAALQAAQAGTLLYRPGDFGELTHSRSPSVTEFEVVNQTTLAAAVRLLADGHQRALALNFASAKNPGGGFLGGSQAQEESLARATGLYACISPVREYYEANRACDSCLYTDHIIYSPAVPVFRDDDDCLLERPYAVSLLTAPAVNAGAVHGNELENVSRIEPVMRQRIANMLTVAAHHGYDAIVLGAWGCGVFRNDAAAVAGWFHDHLTGDGRFSGVFARVIFAVLDRSAGGEVIRPFAERFTPGCS
jgi:uncharacterized protein (TIGR02452 family)